jgi:hypothetical protein
MSQFKLLSDFEPKGDQPQAIEKLSDAVSNGVSHQVLLGVTGSGKTFTMANVIERVQKPTLVISHNKTLAAQLYGEFKELFPENAVEFFVSYYDYYQPEAYIPSTDTYIEKDTLINEDIDRCDTLPPVRFSREMMSLSSPVSPVFTALVLRRLTTECSSIWKKGWRSPERRSFRNWWRSNMNGMISIFIVELLGFEAMSSKFFQRMREAEPSGSSSSEIRLKRSLKLIH